MDWTLEEVKCIVEDYFSMLRLESLGQPYNKTFHRNALKLLISRSDGSIERKHQNISAVLAEMGMPYIRGYKPMVNYQRTLLPYIVNDYITNHRLEVESVFEQFAITVPEAKKIKPFSFEDVIEDQPIPQVVNEKQADYFKPVKIDFQEREQNNRLLGAQGEAFVVEYEQWRLQKAGKDDLAKMIEWVSKDKGDGLGYDIFSKNIDGTDRYIEVKTTKLSKDVPIYVSKNELSFASHFSDSFYLYRVFNWGSNPKIFIKHGAYKDYCMLEAVTWRGKF